MFLSLSRALSQCGYYEFIECEAHSFSSPPGALSILISKSQLVQAQAIRIVPVPSRGSIYLNQRKTSCSASAHKGSRPLPGLYLSQQSSTARRKLRRKSFSSPPGALSISMVSFMLNTLSSVFSSPPGALSISIDIYKYQMREGGFNVLVPSRGSIYLNNEISGIYFGYSQFSSPPGVLSISMILVSTILELNSRISL